MAKRFKFSLQPVLRYREMLEDEKKKEFAIANRALEEEKLRLAKMGEERLTTQEEVRQLYQEKAGFEQVVEAYRYINTLDVQISYRESSLAALQQVVDEKREALVKARREREGLKVLKEKRQADHAMLAAREEQNELDTLAVMVKQRREREEY